MKRIFMLASAILLLFSTYSCKVNSTSTPTFYNVGHRGTRGLMPENTIPAFEKGIEVGANMIEFDVHITKDNKVVVYHDGSFTPSYTLKPDGSDIAKEERKKYTFYQMDYAKIRQFIIGEKYYPAFPEQHLEKTYAPLLSEMIDSVEQFTKTHHYKPVHYLLEIKSNPKTDGFEQPAPEEFMRILMHKLKPYLAPLKGRLVIQSFDARPLKVLHKTHPDIPLGFLAGGNTIDQNLKTLGFVPAYYNPHYSLVNESSMKEADSLKMKVLPWTVEKKAEMKKLIKLGVDGIISDYPNRVTEVLKDMKKDEQ